MIFNAILFDLDGTLLHTVPDLAAGTNAMLKELGRPELAVSEVARFVGKGAENLIHRSLTGDLSAKADSKLFEQAHGIWKRAYEAVNGQYAEFYPGVLSGLEMLKEAGVPMAVVTNKPEQFTLPLLQKTKLDSFFQVIIGGDTCERKKPDPMPLHSACSQMNVRPQEVLMIGDSHNDAQAARAAGISCWLLPYGYNEGQPITDVSCERYIESIEQAALAVLKG